MSCLIVDVVVVQDKIIFIGFITDNEYNLNIDALDIMTDNSELTGKAAHE